MKRVAALAALCLLIGGMPISRQAQAACRIAPVAALPLRDTDGVITVIAAIGGVPVSLVLDTGSDAGLITTEAARALALPRDPAHHTLMRGTGGDGPLVPNVILADLALGPLHVAIPTIPVGTLPFRPRIAPPIAGLIGADLLSRFDLDLDIAAGRLTLYAVRRDSQACAAPPAWTAPFETLALHRIGNRFIADAALDGHPIAALLDTGARSRLIATRAAVNAGVSADALAADPGGTTAGVDLHEALYHWHRFHSLRIGSKTDRDPVLTVARIRDDADMLLGADWFAPRRVWISYATDRLFIQATALPRPPR